jgi:hypothetical protein
MLHRASDFDIFFGTEDKSKKTQRDENCINYNSAGIPAKKTPLVRPKCRYRDNRILKWSFIERGVKVKWTYSPVTAFCDYMNEHSGSI